MPKEISDLKETITKQKTDYETILNALDTKLTEHNKTMETRLKEIEAEKEAKIKETTNLTTKLAETEKKLEETIDRQDNLDDKLKGKFKGKATMITAQTDSGVNPLTGK